MSAVVLLAIGMALVVGGVLVLRLHAFLALVLAAYVVALLTPIDQLRQYGETQVALDKMSQAEADMLAAQSAPARVATEFGVTCEKIGILIAMAAVIGKCLLDSGGAHRIVHSILATFGAARAQLALLSAGFLLAIPVFFDTVFYLLIPIGKALARHVGKDYLLYVLCIVAGATMAHSLVPPTPGPLFVAAELGVDLSAMIVGGLIVGALSVTAGYGFAVWANRRWSFPLPEHDAESAADVHWEDQAPPWWLALAPIVAPVALITLGSWKEFWFTDKSVALTVGAAIALGTLAVQKRRQRGELKQAVQSALMSGGVIILITATGGAFGGVLRQTGIAAEIQELGQGAAQAWVLPLAFGITTLVRTAQGSATVAMITAVPIAAALAGDDLAFHPVYIALAIGCGSKPVPWMNDSGFWIITHMAGIEESDTLRFVSTMMTLMGLVGLAVVVAGASILPLTS